MSAIRGSAPDIRMHAMQQEALRRVRDMQAHAQRAVEEANSRQTAAAAASFSPPFFAQGAPASRPPSPGAAAFANAPGGPPPAQSPPAPPRPAAQGLLGHLFGGGSARRASGGSYAAGQGPAAAARAGYSRPVAGQGGRPAGLLDLLRTRGVAESFGGLGETLHNTISSVSEPISGLLDSFGIDGETLIILLVMWVIFNERGDKTLLLALGYLLL